MKILRKAIILGMVLCASLATIALTGCEEESECKHQWEQVSSTSTCEEAGTLTRKCTLCGKEESVDEPKLGHDMQAYSVSATCTEAGEKSMRCSRCGKTETELISALGHDWIDKEIVEESTCTKEGKKIEICTRCGTERDSIMEKKEHDLRLDLDNPKNRNATCEKAGMEVKICKVCGTVVENITPALEHDFSGSGKVIKEATCEESGILEVSCGRKDCDGINEKTGTSPAVEEREIPALDHDWQTEYTYDKEPTFEQEGSRSIHCKRCEKTKDIESVPKLEREKKVMYEFRVIRQSGDVLKVGLSGVKVTIWNAKKESVAVSDASNFKDGVMKAELFPDDYTATVTGLPAGYAAEESYPIRPGSLVTELVVHASLLSEPAANDTRYALGSVMHDYTFQTIFGVKVKLSELLATKKMVLLNFFYADCTFCKQEMPGLLAAYEAYKEDIAIIMLDIMAYDTPQYIRSELLDPYNVPSSIYVVQDRTPTGEDSQKYNNLCLKFGFVSAPQSVVIDCDGVVAYRHDGADSEIGFRQVFKRFTSAPDWFDTKKTVALQPKKSFQEK